MQVFPLLLDYNPWWTDPRARRARGYPFRRPLQAEVLGRLRRLDDRRATMVLGPRQVGKTVLLRQVADDLLDAGWPVNRIVYFDFSDDRIVEPLTVREVVDLAPEGDADAPPRVLLLDEIGMAKRWDRWLKQAVDRARDRIAVTDSAASLLRGGSRESGLGRWDELLLESLTLAEFAALRGEETQAPGAALIDRYLQIGGFPEHARQDDAPLHAIHSRLREDVVERAIFRDLAGTGIDLMQAKKLFACLVQDAGADFNATALARVLEADPRSVVTWLERLLDTKLLAALDRFAVKARARAQDKRRIYPADHGLVRAFSPLADEATLRPRVFETAVFRHLRALEEAELSYYRIDDRYEIDLCVETRRERIAVEVTSARKVDAAKRRKAENDAKRLGAARLLLVHGGYRDEVAGTTRFLPLPDFLLDVESALLWEPSS